MNEFDSAFESDLLEEMRRQEAPAGFADAVMERTRSERRSAKSAASQHNVVVPAGWPSLLLLAASLLVACGSAWQVHHQQRMRQERQAQQVTAQFNLAMNVTARTLQRIDENVSRAIAAPARKL